MQLRAKYASSVDDLADDSSQVVAHVTPWSAGGEGSGLYFPNRSAAFSGNVCMYDTEMQADLLDKSAQKLAAEHFGCLCSGPN